MKKNLIRVLTLGMMAGLLLTLNACGGSDEEAVDPNATTVAIIQHMDNPAFEDMRDGMTAQLQETYGQDVQVIVKNAQGDASNLQTIVQGLVQDGVDVLAPIGTPATQACVNMEADIPIVFCSVSDPVRAGIMTDLETPDKNATGTSNVIPVEDILTLANRLTPEVQTFGFIYNTSEDNSVSTVEAAKKAMDAAGYDYKESVVSNSSEVQQAAQNLVNQVDAFFVPNDAMVQSAMPLVTAVAREAGKPIYASSAATVESGALATMAMSDEDVGRLTADLIIQVLDGTAIEMIPAVIVPGSDMVINEDFMEAAGFTFPDDVMAEATFVQDAADLK